MKISLNLFASVTGIFFLAMPIATAHAASQIASSTVQSTPAPGAAAAPSVIVTPNQPWRPAPGPLLPYSDLARVIRDEPTSLVIRTQIEVAQAYARGVIFASCLLNGEDPTAILRSGIGSLQERRLLDRMSRRNVRCGGDAGGASVYLLRAALGESFVASSPSNELISSFSSQNVSVPPANMPGLDPKLPRPMSIALRVAQCQISAQPFTARAVLATQIGSDAEDRAEMALFAAAPSCAGSVRPVSMQAVIYRAILADMLSRDLVNNGRRVKVAFVASKPVLKVR